MDQQRTRTPGGLGTGLALVLVAGFAAGCVGPHDRNGAPGTVAGDPGVAAAASAAPSTPGGPDGRWDLTAGPSAAPEASPDPEAVTDPDPVAQVAAGSSEPEPSASSAPPAMPTAVARSTTEVDALLVELDRLLGQLDGDVSAADAAVTNPGE
jgi:hypothetical protein